MRYLISLICAVMVLVTSFSCAPKTSTAEIKPRPAMTLASTGRPRPAAQVSDPVAEPHSQRLSEGAAALEKVGLEEQWDLPIKLKGRERVAKLWALDKMLYCLTSENRLFAIDATIGSKLWSYKLGSPLETVFPPSHSDDMILTEKLYDMEKLDNSDAPAKYQFNAMVINTYAKVFVFNRRTGKIFREINFKDLGTSNSASTGGSCDSKYFYFSSAKGWFYGLR
ncbi:MAG TPA: hypothetical protein ENL03_06720, partial [Phycisphaerae bacterium]|nr:hypothetical protein [Phycisphaerae bacterium]